MTDFKYDVAFSLASEDEAWADGVAATLRAAGVRLFYYKDKQSDLWGKDVATFFPRLFQREARFMVVFVRVKRDYLTIGWP